MKESFVRDLRIQQSVLIKVGLMKEKFEDIFSELIALVEQIGFSSGWGYS